MNREDVMRLADKIGWHQNKDFKDFEDLWIASADLVARFYDAAYAAGAAAEREACADKTGEFARKWWSIHCASNKHMETTRKAHDDFCALQAAIRARGQA